MAEPSYRELEDYRARIDELDAALVDILAERFVLTRNVGEFKAKVGLAPSDPARQNRQIGRLRALAAQSGVSPDLVESLVKLIFAEVVANHQSIADR